MGSSQAQASGIPEADLIDGTYLAQSASGAFPD